MKQKGSDLGGILGTLSDDDGSSAQEDGREPGGNIHWCHVAGGLQSVARLMISSCAKLVQVGSWLVVAGAV